MTHYTIDIALRVDDAALLWDAAAARAVAIPGIVLEDVFDLIGPREDAEVAACLTMLLDPSALAGCTVRRFACTPSDTARPTGGLPARLGAPLAALIHVGDRPKHHRRPIAG